MCGPSQPHYKLGGLMNNLSSLPTSKGWYNLYDSFGNFYGFEIYGIHEYPVGRDLVYSFATLQRQLSGDFYSQQYIGETEKSPNRFYSHEDKHNAIALGATTLLIHRVNSLGGASRFEIEKRLIATYQPILNEQHNPRYHTLGTVLSKIGN